MLWRLFTEELPTKNGFYIDVGAFHPRQYSNTWLLRKRLGFHGINIEPSEKSILQFIIRRRNDINLEVLIGRESGVSKYAYNEKEPAHSKIDENGYFMYKYSLSDVCSSYNVSSIDLLDIDVEGYELPILEGHDWRISPKVIVCEINNEETDIFIRQKGYELYGRTKRNGIYVQKND